MATPTSPVDACGTERFKAAIFEQKPLIEYEVNQEIVSSKRYMLRKIAEGDMNDPHDDATTIKFRRSFQAPVGYNEVDHSVRPLVPGVQEAQAPCKTATAEFSTNINDIDPNACEGVCIVDFAQGFEFEDFKDYELKLGTPTRCIEELARMERRFVRQFLMQEKESLVETAFESLDNHLIKTAITRGGANASVKSVLLQKLPVLTEGGWDGPPTHPVSIYFLDHYRTQIVQRLKSAGKLVDEANFILEVEMTRDSVRRALIAETLQRTGPGGWVPGLGDQIRIDESIITKGRMEGRSSYTWENKIRFVFNETPIRGFFKPNGLDADGNQKWEFIRVYHRINITEGLAAGTAAVYNPQYDYTTVCCDGADYRMIELIPHIHNDSFKRYGLSKAIGPDGVEAEGNMFQVSLKMGDALSSKDCVNDFDTYYTYRTRHQFRWRDVYPEFSGFIAHVHTILAGYDIELENEVLKVRGGEACSTYQDVDNCNYDPGCPDENCIVDDCVGDGSDNVTTLTPCGDVLASFFGADAQGETGPLVLTAERDSKCAVPDADVSYEVTGGTAVSGTHFQVIDEDRNVLPDVGVLSWGAGESGPKSICIEVLDALPDTPAAPSTDDCCENGTDAVPNDATFTVEIKNAAGTTLGTCTVANVTIRNRAPGTVGACVFE